MNSLIHIQDIIIECDEKYFGLQHSLQLINLECDSSDGPVPITFPPIKTETKVS